MHQHKGIKQQRFAQRPRFILSLFVDVVEERNHRRVGERNGNRDSEMERIVVNGRINGEGSG